MWCFLKRAGFRLLPMLLLGWLLADWAACAKAQEVVVLAPQVPAPPPGIALSPGGDQEFLDRLRAMEQRLDHLTKQNEDLRLENKTLVERLQYPYGGSINPARYGAPSAGLDSLTAPGVTTAKGEGAVVFGANGPAPRLGAVQAMGSDPGSASSDSDWGADPTRAGKCLWRADGGDPPSVAQPQEVSHRHLGKTGLNAYYDFEKAGFHLDTPDKEFSFEVSGLMQLDGMLYSRPTPGVATSGFYNPATWVIFKGNATEPISWDFSFQNFYDTVALLDAYINFNYDPRFQVQIGRFKNPFGYEFYHMALWDLMAPERSLFANNYSGGRRFGVMGHGDLFDECLEYALGGFNSQRNSLRPFNNRLDFEAFLNFKPFYDREEGFWLRNLQFGGSVDLGNENQAPVPELLRTNQGEGGAQFESTVASSAASPPFLGLGPNVLERGPRALWEAHLAYYLGGLSLVTALEGGHESYANGPTAPVHIPLDGWFVQAGYLLTGETIRDRTTIHPLHPFDLREGCKGLGAWEVTARYSQLDLDSRIFTASLADPSLWTNHAKLVDVGVNWYLNQFVRVTFDWEHAMFDSPVFSSSGQFPRSNDLFWLRAQLSF
jgi:phosphate-selective porin OprO/OprP